MAITKDMTMGQILAIDDGIADILMGAGMHCIFCPAHQAESLEDGCLVHGLDPDAILANINEYLALKNNCSFK